MDSLSSIFSQKLHISQPEESHQFSSTNWHAIPQEVRKIIFYMVPKEQNLSMLITSRSEQRNISIISTRHLSEVVSKYYSLSNDKRPRCSIIDVVLQNDAYPLNLKFAIENINNLPAVLWKRANLSLKLMGVVNTIKDLHIDVLKKVTSAQCLPHIASEHFHELILNCPELEELDIQECKDIRYPNFSNILSTKIKRLDVSKSSVTSQGLATLLEKCPELVKLNIYNCRNIQNLDLSNVPSTQIQKINASFSSLTSRSLIALLKKCPELEALDIRFCIDIRYLNLSNILSTKIKRLDVSESSITSQGLVVLLEKCPELEELDIKRCKNINGLDLSQHIKSTKIKRINTSKSSITSQGLEALLEKYPELEVR